MKAAVLQRRQPATGNGSWGDGDSTTKSDRPGGAWRRCGGNLPSACQLRLVGQIRQTNRSQIRRFLQPPGGWFGRDRAEGRRNLSDRQALHRRRPYLRAGGGSELSRRGNGFLVWR